MKTLTACSLVILAAGAAHADVFNLGPGLTNLSFVPVGNAGNAGNLEPQGVFGAVAYDYRIGRHEVTNAQYASMLRNVAASDPNGLYNPGMAGVNGGIVRNGVDGAYTYALVPGRENHPVNFTSFYDAVRFANWLHNGQGAGDTENGAYTLTGPESIVGGRADDARFALTSEDEWYKAAYHQPAAPGGVGDIYWMYPQMSNVAPTPGVHANMSNFFFDSTEVGTFAAFPSHYGTLDQGGNVWEWNESFVATGRGARGGFWSNPEMEQRSSNRDWANANAESMGTGFRISAPVPSPGTGALLGMGALAALRRRRREVDRNLNR